MFLIRSGGPEFARWARLVVARGTCGSSAVTLAARAGAGRHGEGRPGNGPTAFVYAEYAPSSDCRVWMSAGYAFAAVVRAAAFLNHAWPADVRGSAVDYVGGGLGDRFCRSNPFRTDPDHVWVRAAARPGPSRPDGSVSGRSGADAALGAALRPKEAVFFRGAQAYKHRRELHRLDRGCRQRPTRGSRRSSIRSSAPRGFAHYVQIIGT